MMMFSKVIGDYENNMLYQEIYTIGSGKHLFQMINGKRNGWLLRHIIKLNTILLSCGKEGSSNILRIHTLRYPQNRKR
jgi:hypothetical protein